MLKQNSPDIHLIGHTDPKGNAEKNRKLSEQRANTVKQFLIEKKYKGTIKVTGEGESQALKSQYSKPLAHYGQARWYRMLRRVEIKTD